MALTGLDIFKQLPKTNCGDCGVPTCLAFAMKLAAAAAELEQCPWVAEEAIAALGEASAPPIRGVVIGTGDYSFKIGEELVKFRHEKTFYNQPGYALLVSTDMDSAKVDSMLTEAMASQFERIGQTLRADAVVVHDANGDAGAFTALVTKADGAVDFPLVLSTQDVSTMSAALALPGIADKRPLLYSATESNADDMAKLALDNKCPLAIRSESGGYDGLEALSNKVSGLGVKDIVLDPGTRTAAATHEALVYIRRSALDKKFKAFGFPVITFPCQETDDELMEALNASLYTMKYAGLMVLSGLEAWKVLPLTTLRQNIYTDPQRPMQVTEGLYPIGNPGPDSPVLLTTNFSLTYFIVSAEVEASRVPTWLAIMDAEGMSVLTAWAAGKFVSDRIATFVKRSDIASSVSHRTLVIPGYVAQMSGELEDELGGEWKIQVGSREAADLPNYLKSWSA